MPRSENIVPAAERIELRTPLALVPGISRPAAEALAVGLGVTNVGKLVAHLPSRHELQEAEATVPEIVPGRIVSVRGEVTATSVWPRGKRPRIEAVLHDGLGRLELMWFNMLYLREKIKPGVRLWVQGKAVKRGSGVQIVNPRHMVLDPEQDEPGLRQARVRPVYPASEQIKSWQIEKIMGTVLPGALPLIEDHLTAEYRAARSLPVLADAYRMMHQPKGEDEVLAGRRRLAYDEFLLLQLGVHMKRVHLRDTMRAPALAWSEAIDREIRARFPFTLTAAQDKVIAELKADLSKPTPTNRLIQGDVGSGKTIVALYAMLMAVASGKQAALMAPTELLAEQHHANISRILKGSGIRVELLTGAMDAMERERVVAGLADGRVHLAIGTHALITESVRFKDLAVAIIDEQHRFGVHQRAELRAKGTGTGFMAVTPHVVVMTATPIPRTMAITLFGDLDTSIIEGLPPGRKPVKTKVVSAEKRAEVYAALLKRLEKGERAYVVVPTIGDEESGATSYEDGELLSVRSVVRELEAGPLKGKRIAALHGRLRRQTRDAVMERFRTGLIDVLVATTVIEVGVDVAEATAMIVEHADRFGLAQLHQLRGRVGRGSKESVCYLIGDATTEGAIARLQVMEKSNDGFVLAEKDFEIRGPGELFGTKQSGLPPFKVADLIRDRELLGMARRDAAEWVAKSPMLGKPEEALVKRRLLKAYGESLGLVDVG
ncbi:MAG: ATP-dependent DNA helicase RecG [Tepidisphaera sp.]